MVIDANWIEPPKILLLFRGGIQSVGYYDWYYDVSGNGYNNLSAWISQDSGEQLDLLYDPPTHWMPLPESPIGGTWETEKICIFGE